MNMMSIQQFLLLLSLAVFAMQVQAFSIYQPLNIQSRVASTKQYRGIVLHMSDDDAMSEAEKLKAKARALKEEAAALAGTSVEEMEKKEVEQKVTSTDGTLYDDEAPAYKDPLSDNMRKRLMAEASTGLDSDKKQTNVILYISIAVAILVLLGGEGILY